MHSKNRDSAVSLVITENPRYSYTFQWVCFGISITKEGKGSFYEDSPTANEGDSVERNPHFPCNVWRANGGVGRGSFVDIMGGPNGPHPTLLPDIGSWPMAHEAMGPRLRPSKSPTTSKSWTVLDHVLKGMVVVCRLPFYIEDCNPSTSSPGSTMFFMIDLSG